MDFEIAKLERAIKDIEKAIKIAKAEKKDTMEFYELLEYARSSIASIIDID
jgi:hypothetical protein